jgi:hypothetical protein
MSATPPDDSSATASSASWSLMNSRKASLTQRSTAGTPLRAQHITSTRSQDTHQAAVGSDDEALSR